MDKIINIKIDIEALGDGLFDLYKECKEDICGSNLANDIRDEIAMYLGDEIAAHLSTCGFYEIVDGLFDYYKPYIEKYLAKQGLKIIDDDKD